MDVAKGGRDGSSSSLVGEQRRGWGPVLPLHSAVFGLPGKLIVKRGQTSADYVLRKALLENAKSMMRFAKAQRDTLSGFMRAYESQSEPMMASVEKFIEESDDSVPLKGFLENAKRFMEDTKNIMRETRTVLEADQEKLDASRADLELQLENLKEYIKGSEEYLAEFSRLDEDKLKNLKGNVQKWENQIALIKAQRGFLSGYVTEYESQAAPMMASLETLVDESPDNTLRLLLKGFLEKARSAMRDSRALMENEYLDAEIADIELEVVKLKKFIKSSEEFLAEL
ncbi:hypothetical protein EYF80_039314 [Liparis tanakae]|uniref:Uncharacterized protein n=1 Tax=Liparis tanakae TaxID=230148 RepID=A0A4Z2GCS3_9TELE|nr:hypothetical protein EYF80_039314 [Liparis tanakae]